MVLNTYPTSPKELLQTAYTWSKDTTLEVRYPVIYNLQNMLSQWTDYNTRIAALEDICKHHVEYLRPLGVPDQVCASIYLDCNSLICYNKALVQLLKQKSNQHVIAVNQDMNKLDLEGYIYTYSLCDLDISYFLAYAEGICHYDSHAEKDFNFQLHMPVLQVGNFIRTLNFTDCFNFCHHIYKGEFERRRRTFLWRKGDSYTIRDFDINLRNRCFNEYIRLRRLIIKDQMDHDNMLVHVPKEQDYLTCFYHTELQVLNQQLNYIPSIDESTNSSHNFPEREDVLSMAKIFIQYLKDYIAELGVKVTAIEPSHQRVQLTTPSHSHSLSSDSPTIPSAELLAQYLPDVSDIIIEQIKDFREKAEPKGFFLLSKVQAISRPNQALLIRELQTAAKAYRFAMAYYLGWYTYLEEHIPGYQESGKRARFFAELFEVNERDAKGYINVLKEGSKENDERYNSRSFLSDVEKFYYTLLPSL